MMANIFFIFPSPSLSSSFPPSKEWPEVMIHKYTDSSIYSNSIPDIISLVFIVPRHYVQLETSPRNHNTSAVTDWITEK